MTAVDAKGKSLRVGATAKVALSGKHVKVNGTAMTSPVTLRSSGALKYGSTRYEGEMLFVRIGSGLTVVNKLDVEKYLCGVIKMEANPAWPAESLKAQVIISRTFTLSHLGQHRSKGFDLTATPSSQVYRGLNAQDPRVDRVIAATKGMVLVYGGQLARTFFHSDSGGATANVADVWGSPIPYLTGVEDPFPSESKYASWQVRLTGAEIARALAKKGHRVGTVQSLAIVERDKSGRPKTLEVRGTAATVRISTSQFRNLVGPERLRSTFFELGGAMPTLLHSASLPPAPAVKPTSSVQYDTTPLTGSQEKQLDAMVDQGKFSSAELIDMLVHPERRSHYLKKASGEAVSAAPAPVPAPAAVPLPVTKAVQPQRVSEARAQNGAFTFSGRGNGHGVGLSQWGAKAMADRGWSVEQILGHYYPGTRLEKR